MERFRIRKSCMRICISDRQIDDFRQLSSGSVTSLDGWGGWRAGRRWSRLWCPLSASGGWRCTYSFVYPWCLRILCGSILPRKAAGSLVLTKHCRVSLYRSLDLVMPRKLNTPHLLFSDLAAWFLNQIFRFLHCGARKAFFGHFGHIQHQAHVGLFQLYPASLPCHSCRHVENLQDISCCFWQWNMAVTSTIYASLASSKVINTCFVHPQGCLSENSSAKIPQLATSWCWISWTVRTNVFVHHGGFPLWAAINLLCSSLRTLTVRYSVHWPLVPLIWIHSHPTACCYLFSLLPVLQTIFKWTSWVICLVAAVAASWWTNLCLRYCCVPRISVLDVTPANRPVFDPLSHGGGGCVSMMCWCGIGEEDDNERKWEVRRMT